MRRHLLAIPALWTLASCTAPESAKDVFALDEDSAAASTGEQPPTTDVTDDDGPRGPSDGGPGTSEGADATAPTMGNEMAPQDAGPPTDPAPDASAPLDPVAGCPPWQRRAPHPLAAGTEIVVDETWTCDRAYYLAGDVFVTEGATLSIEAGVEVRAAAGATLIVSRGARLVARGRRGAPIVFTSAAAAGERAPGDWRGLVLLGGATTNQPANARVDSTTTIDDARGFYGGPSDDGPLADCGELQFVAIHFAGGEADDEGSPAAALSLAGCGQATRVDHVHVHRATDGIGLYGGNVDLRRVLLTQFRTDGVEWVGGYRGTLQFVALQQTLGTGTAIKGNNHERNPNASPASAPAVHNATIVGVDRGIANTDETGVRFQFGSEGTLRNSLIVGHHHLAVDVAGPVSGGAAQARRLDVTHSLFFSAAAPFAAGNDDPTGDDDFDEDAQWRMSDRFNRFVDPGMPEPDLAHPSFRPTTNTVEGGLLLQDDRFETTTHAGALPWERSGEDDWTAEWTTFPSD